MMFKKILQWQFECSMAFDKAFIDKKYHVYGASDYIDNIMPKYLDRNLTVIEIGGGKSPRITQKIKDKYSLKLIGLDIDESELKRAPNGLYDEVKVADITKDKGTEIADILLCRSLLEHVESTSKALEVMGTYLRPGGKLLIFAPCRNAIFARLNLLMPESIKNKLIDYLYDNQVKQSELMGFPAYYAECTPKKIEENANKYGFKIVQKKLYYMSNYFAFFTPAHILWRGYQFVITRLGAENFCEGFSYVFEKE